MGDTPHHFRQTLDFLLRDWLCIESLSRRPRHADHGWDTYAPVLDLCEHIAAEKYAPAHRLSDTQEPQFVDGQVVLPQATLEALRAYVDSGMLAASNDQEHGGLQLPYTIEVAGNAIFAKSCVAFCVYAGLTTANANLLLAHGTPAQVEAFARPLLAGRAFGTMCLSETQAGSSLAEIRTRAVLEDADQPLGPQYRLFGEKMWISAGDHPITDNIVHLVLAKIADEHGQVPRGTQGLSLFIVPKCMPADAAGQGAGRNDVALAGLNHKLGYRGTTNCVLSFGAGYTQPGGQPGAVGYLVGQPGEGLRCMFHMMNEARINTGVAAAMIGYAGYEASLAYARERRQGRTATNAGPVAIVEHGDVRRMLLTQKSYVEGGLALALYGARLVDDIRTGTAPEQARALLDVLIPIIKSWPSEWGLEANSLAIQVLGGYGYTRDFSVEQHWRDNRLNMIHEGTHGIQALDLMARKVGLDRGRSLALLAERVRATAAAAAPEWAEQATALNRVTQVVLDHSAVLCADAASQACATPYMQALGHWVVAWLWLDLVQCLRDDSTFSQGKRAAARSFFVFEVPKIDAWLASVKSGAALLEAVEPAWL